MNYLTWLQQKSAQHSSNPSNFPLQAARLLFSTVFA